MYKNTCKPCVCNVQASNPASPGVHSRFGPKLATSQLQDATLRPAPAGYGPSFAYTGTQGPQRQMNPLSTDYAGLQQMYLPE